MLTSLKAAPHRDAAHEDALPWRAYYFFECDGRMLPLIGASRR
jgi:hypothetical protein